MKILPKLQRHTDQGMSFTSRDEEKQLKEALAKLESQISEQKQLVQQMLQLKQKRIDEDKKKFSYIKTIVDNQNHEEEIIKKKENKITKPAHNTAKNNSKSNQRTQPEISTLDTPFTRRILANRVKNYYQNRYFFNGYKFVLHNDQLILLSTHHELTNKPLLNADSMPAFITFKGNTYIKSPTGNYTLENLNRKYARNPANLNKNTVLTSSPCSHNEPKPFCIYYTSTGHCNKPRCQFQHIPNRVALCPTLQSTRHKCLNKVCHFSHVPSQYNSPSCKFFQSGECSNENCIFTHKMENLKAPICREFAYIGYCEDGLECRFTHSKQCPDLKEYGRCLRGRVCMCVHNTEIIDTEAKALEVRNKDNDNVIQIVYEKNIDSDEEENSDSDDDNVEFIVGPNGHELSSNANFVKL